VQLNIPDNGVPGILTRALSLALAAMLLVALAAGASLCASLSPAAVPSAAARPVRSGAQKSAGPQAANNTKAGGQDNSPFGMLKFSSSNNGPIQIKADSLDLDYKNNQVEFKGGVHASQSGTTLTSKSLKVLYGAKFGEIKQVIALGDVRMTQGGRWATGQRAVLDEVKHTVEMTGDPVIHDGPDSVAGRRIIIYLDSEKSFVENAIAVIHPRNNGKPDHEAAD
jgi:lipopolysaccharide export system protein LptA